MPTLYEYIMKLIPDLSYIDYIEKEYWNGNRVEKPWFKVLDISNGSVNNHEIDFDRCLIVSSTALEISKENNIVEEINKYGDRIVYVYIRDDTEDSVQSKINTRTIDPDYPYVIELGF